MHSSKLDWQNVETTSCRYGTMSYLKSDLIIGRALREYGEWAQGELDFLLDLIDVGNTVIDVGAFVGTHTLAFAQHVGPEGKVYAFEPQPIAFELLSLNIAQNGLSNVKPFNVALSDATGAVRLHKTDLASVDNPAKFSLLTGSEVASADSNSVAIELTTLDQYDIDRCDLIKVDVEGTELNVLRGSAETLRRFRPLVFAECLSLHNGWQIVLFMRDKGFEAFLHNELSYNRDNFRKNTSNFLGDARETNIVFVATNRISAFRDRCKHLENLIPLSSLDDLALGMLKKPQYKYEVLALTGAAQVLGLDFLANEPELKQLADKAGRVEPLEEKVSQRGNLEASLQEKVSQITSLETILQEKDSQITNLEAQIHQIQRGIVVQLMNRYQRVVEKLLRPGTRRRYYYELGLTGIRVILNEGWRSFWAKLKLWLRVKKVKYAAASDRSVYLAEPPLGHGEEVHIVVPVYNAFDWTRRCLTAVLSFTVGIPYRLIVVDDGSTDQRLLEYLACLESRNSNLIVLRNRKNVGFLESVNRGMSFSNKDVVLLNSDAIVTYDWLRKLRACAYSDDRIATVTPLSNNATVCSVPEFCRNNQIPPGYSVQEFGELVEKASQRLGVSFYELPVGIGFCMYIKRKVISEVGLFSEKFGRGYEEEVDFCLRASEKGYCHVACPSVFVYHAGTTSTNREQAQLLESKNWNILVKKHPYYPMLVTDFTARNPMSDIQMAIRRDIEMRPIQPLSIGIDAQLLVRNSWTGTERYSAGLIDGLVSLDSQNRYTIFTADGNLDKCYQQNSKFQRKHALDSTDILWDPDFYSTDVFHRTFQCYSAFDLLLLLNAKASVITILDLISYHHPDYFPNALLYDRYQRITGLAAKAADRIIAISEHCKKDIAENLHVVPEKIDVVYPALLDTSKFKKIEDPSALSYFKAKYNIRNKYILYVATTFPHKNHEGLISAYECLLDNLGSERASLPDLILIAPDTHLNRGRIIESRLAKIKDKVRLLDYVPDDDMPLFYNCASLFVFPSLYEGFGLPLLEAMAYEVPVVASNATSIPEVVGDAAVLVDCTQPKQLADAIYSVLSDAGIRSKLVERGKKRIKLFSTAEMVEKTLEVYKAAHQASLGDRPKLPDEIAMEIKGLAKEDGADLFLAHG